LPLTPVASSDLDAPDTLQARLAPALVDRGRGLPRRRHLACAPEAITALRLATSARSAWISAAALSSLAGGPDRIVSSVARLARI